MIILLLFLSAVLSSSQGSQDSDGCTAPFLLEDKPFVVIWNEPSDSCHKVQLNLTEWGIVTNDDDRFMGNNMVLFYGIGDWPYFYKSGNKYLPHNGGIPQVMNRTKHFLKVVQTTKSAIPRNDFSGVAVIDFESWRPFFYHNFDSLSIYKDRSVDLVKARFPSWKNRTRVWAEAEREFENAARILMQGTLKEVRSLRPNGKWGYYGFPRCYGVSRSRLTCKYPQTSSANDEIGWLFEGSTGLYPRIYTDPKTSLRTRAEYVRQEINETLRVQAKFSDLYRPILPYSVCQKDKIFFDKLDLEVAIKEPADMGSSGVVLWGSSSLFRLKNECQNLKNYIKTVLGPFVQKLTNFMSSCYKDYCSGHGRCVRKDYEAMTQKHLSDNNKPKCRKPLSEYADVAPNTWTETNDFTKTKLAEFDGVSRKESNKYVETFRQNTDEDSTGRKSSQTSPYHNYVCRCLAGWAGPHCSKRV